MNEDILRQAAVLTNSGIKASYHLSLIPLVQSSAEALGVGLLLETRQGNPAASNHKMMATCRVAKTHCRQGPASSTPPWPVTRVLLGHRSAAVWTAPDCSLPDDGP